MSKPRSGPAPIQGSPKPTLDTRKPAPGNGTEAASVGGGNFDVDAGDPSLPLPLLLLLKLREGNGDCCPKELTIGGASLGTHRRSRIHDNGRLQHNLGSRKAALDTRLIARAQRRQLVLRRRNVLGVQIMEILPFGVWLPKLIELPSSKKHRKTAGHFLVLSRRLRGGSTPPVGRDGQRKTLPHGLCPLSPSL